ncbi:MAG: hypothetical protein GY765_32790 [bacterium]|nr:hypothetical protein [bacterium]
MIAETKDIEPISIGYFITPHGFGHAARATAVMEALADSGAVRFEIYTTVPEFFFKESLPGIPFNYHYLATDIGLVQETSHHVDLPETFRRLERLLPFGKDFIEGPAKEIEESRCKLIICDIAPLGIAVAAEAGIPSVLIENFTWDWIYEEYLEEAPFMKRHIDYLHKFFNSANFHIRTEPAFPRGNTSMVTAPVSRKQRLSRAEVRKQLEIPMDAKVVLITMGGIPGRLPFLDALGQYRTVTFIIPGSPAFSRQGNVLRLPFDSGFFHPDLIHAADAVIGKPGYSTVAEVYHAGVPFAYVPRRNFRESDVLEAFIKKHMHCFAIPEETFYEGQWLERLGELLKHPPIRRAEKNGSIRAAEYINEILAECRRQLPT